MFFHVATDDEYMDDISSNSFRGLQLISRFPTCLSLLELKLITKSIMINYVGYCGLKVCRRLCLLRLHMVATRQARDADLRNGASAVERELDRIRSWSALLPRLLDCWTSNVKVTGSKSSQIRIKNRG